MPNRVLIAGLLGGLIAASPAPSRSPRGRKARGAMHPARAGKRHGPPRRAPRLQLPSAQQERYRILGQLKNPDPSLRANACWQAGVLRIGRAYQTLRKLLGDKDPLVRRNAAYAVGRLANPEGAIALYDRIIREQVPDVLAQQAIALGRLRYRPARAMLVGLLSRRDPALRAAAIEALGYLGDPLDVYTIGRFLKAGDPVLRQTAATALGRLGSGRARGRLLRLLADPAAAVQRAAVQSLAKLGAREAITPLIRLLGQSSGAVALATVRALARLDALKAVPHLQQLLTRTQDAPLAAEAALATAHLAGQVDPARLLRLLGSRENHVRIPAVRAAGLAGIRRAIPVLVSLLDHPHPALRLHVVEALGRLAAHQTARALVDRLTQEHGAQRAELARALGRMRALTALPALTHLLRDPDPRVVIAAAEAIGELSLLDRRSVLPLAKRLGLLMIVNRSPWVGRAGALAFARLHPRKHIKGLTRMLRLTLHQRPEVRARAVRALGLFGNRLASSAVLRLLADKAPEVRCQAALASARLHLTKGFARILALERATQAKLHPLRWARYLLALAILDSSRRRRAGAVLGELLSTGPNTPDKAELVTQLAATRGRWVTALLQRARRSESYLVRAAARRALSIWPPDVTPPPTRPKKRQTRPRSRRVKASPPASTEEEEPLAGPFKPSDPGDQGCGCSAASAGSGAPMGKWPVLWPLLWLIWRRRRPARP